MDEVHFKGQKLSINQSLPTVGTTVPNFSLVDASLNTRSLEDFKDKKKVLSIFPSIDTQVCALSVKKFHDALAKEKDLVVINISKDLPFAQVRFCAAEGLENIEVLSDFRGNFSQLYGGQMISGPLEGLLIRAVLVLDKDNTLIHKEVSGDITQELDYEKVFQALQGAVR